ncbi:MAG TPA: hypothetical protein VFU16_05215 [Solirubrobacterales bacterium]|nr:hypothetical protein [Solirubrobacterales bacterium]
MLILVMVAPGRAGAAVDHWTTQAPPTPNIFTTQHKLAGISCSAANACTAVGTAQLGGLVVTLVERWASGNWSAQATPLPEGSAETVLRGVSCPGSSSCLAVGTYLTGNTSTYDPLAYIWNGSTWTAQFPPVPAESLGAKLEAISCISTEECFAAGYYLDKAEKKVVLIEKWNGENWAVQTIPSPKESEEAVLSGISCPGLSLCIAAGSYKTGGTVKPLAERFNKGEMAWEAQLPPFPEKALEAKLEAISCASSICMATGYTKNSSGIKVNLAEQWTEKGWAISTVPSPESEEASLAGVSCGADGFCLGTGSYKSGSATKTQAARWNGTTWSSTTPLNVELSSSLAGVYCYSTTSCTTVGSYTNSSSKVLPLAETYKRIEAPVNTSLPSISPSTPETGKAATASTGTWTEEPTGYAYQWKRCNASGLECTNISGATKSSYTPLEADLEKTLRVEVTASNLGGSTSATSNASGKVKKAGSIVEYALPAGSQPTGITAGPDENLWFTNCTSNKIGKITTTGTITEYPIGAGGGSCPISITTGPDGNLWFSFASTSSKVAKITTSGTVTRYELSKAMNNGRVITTGPDGNLWFTATEGNIGKITTSGTFTPYASAGQPHGITAGPDGNLWFTQFSGNKIVKSTTSGTMTEYSLPGSTAPYGITSGPDEKLWFGAKNKVGKITTSGTITEYSLPVAGEVKGIDEGPEGLLWFAHTGADRIGKITTGGTITEYSLAAGSNPWWVSPGPDGNVWFTLSGSDRIGMIEP